MSANQLVVDPEKLKLVVYPHPALYIKSDDVPMNEDGFAEPDLVRKIGARMEKVMRSMGRTAIGLAANQVGLTWRMFVCLDDLNLPGPLDRAARVYVNPKVIFTVGLESQEEGCLSFPGVKGQVSRPSKAHIEYFDLDGHIQVVTLSDLQARCCLHEIDHLDGVNIWDKFSETDRKRNTPIIKRLSSK